jgi:hypothetical protein
MIFDMATGEMTIDGPLTREQAGAEKASTEYIFQGISRYFEIEHELKRDPSNKKLRRELAEHKIYLDYAEKQGKRNIRREILKRSRGKYGQNSRSAVRLSWSDSKSWLGEGEERWPKPKQSHGSRMTRCG